MDNLAKDAFIARQNRMSYGQYMAMFKPKVEKKKAIPKEEVSRHTCQHCGKVFSQYDNRRRLYCSNHCKQAADYKRKCERGKVKRGKAKNARDE